MKKELEKHNTNNLYEASYCLCVGLKMIGKQGIGGKITVLFEGKNAQQKAMKYYNGGKVSAKAYSDAYRTLKDYVFQDVKKGA